MAGDAADTVTVNWVVLAADSVAVTFTAVPESSAMVVASRFSVTTDVRPRRGAAGPGGRPGAVALVVVGLHLHLVFGVGGEARDGG